MSKLIEPSRHTFLTTYVMSFFWILVILRQNYIIDYLRLTLYVICIVGIVFNTFYGAKWEDKYGYSAKTRRTSNVIFHILPFVYLLLIKSKYNIRYSRQIIAMLLIFLTYSVLINPIDQYLA